MCAYVLIIFSFQSFPALNCFLDYDWSVSSTSQRLKSSNIQEKVKCSKCFGSKSRKHLPKQLETIRLAQGLHWRIQRYKSFKSFKIPFLCPGPIPRRFLSSKILPGLRPSRLWRQDRWRWSLIVSLQSGKMYLKIK